jgi:hypothetical protein
MQLRPELEPEEVHLLAEAVERMVERSPPVVEVSLGAAARPSMSRLVATSAQPTGGRCSISVAAW